MIISVNKKKNMTSRDVVNILNKHFNTKKIGHTGTLDPIASGVLICCIDKDTKLVNYITCDDKEYVATMKLGIKTDTLDITGKIIDKKDFNVDKLNVINTLNSFLGESIQEVPIYSAIKINGKKLYEYARNNETVDLPKRKIYIKEIELLNINRDMIKFRVVVSKGTYIRSLINDIASKLGTVGTMVDLVRTRQGIFKIEDCNSIEDILSNHYNIISYEEIFKNVDKVELNELELKKVSNGVKMNNTKDVIYMYQGKYIALYNAYGKVEVMLDR